MRLKSTLRKIPLVALTAVFLTGCGVSNSLLGSNGGEQTLVGLRVMEMEEKTEVVIQGKEALQYTVFSLENPPRFVVNLLSTRLGSGIESIEGRTGVIKEVKVHETKNPHYAVRLEVFLHQKVKPKLLNKASALHLEFPGGGDYDHQKVVDQYRVGPEDILEVMVWKNEDLSRVVSVRPDGRVSLPLVGDIKASGLSTEELKVVITEKLKDYINSPEVSVMVNAINSYFFHILGEVIKPGKYPIKERTTILQAISMAGGFSPFADKNKISVFRNGPTDMKETKLRVRYDDILSSKDPGGNLVIQAGDTIVVP